MLTHGKFHPRSCLEIPLLANKSLLKHNQVPMVGENPTISVVMSVHNGEIYLQQAVESILNQSFSDFEFIIIDDGSTDGSNEILRRFAATDTRVRLITRENRGLTKSLNEGVALARGEFIARMDVDDVALPQRLERQLAHLLSNPNISALGTWVRFIDADSKASGESHSSTHPTVLAWELSMSNVIWHPTILMRHEWLSKLGGYDESFSVAQDFDLWSRIFRAGGQVAVLPEVLLCYRWSKNQVSKTRAKEQGQAVMKVLQKHNAWLTGYEADGAVVECIWNVMGVGKNENCQTVSQALRMALISLHACKKKSESRNFKILQEVAFWRFMHKADDLTQTNPKAAMRCVVTAVRANPGVMLHRSFVKLITLTWLLACKRRLSSSEKPSRK